MSDDPILAALARIELEQARLREQTNNMLDRLSALRQDTDSLRGQALYILQDSLTLSQRISKIEDELRRR